MKLNHLIIASLVYFFAFGCTTEPSANQPAESPIVTSTAVNTASPENRSAETDKSTQPTAARTGTFVAGEHPTQGTVRIVTKNGQSSLELDQAFKTSEMGPDLVVILHRSDNVIGSTKPPAYSLQEGDYAIIAPLKKFSGAQSYVIPNNINLEDYKSAVIWCRKFNATFGAATLSS